MLNHILGWIAGYSAQLILYSTLAAALACVVWESSRPLGPWRSDAFNRVAANIMLRAINWFAGRTAMVGAVGATGALCAAGQWCVVSVSALPLWPAITVTLVTASLTAYLLHRLYHAVPWLWRIHRVHHSDLDVDFSTGIRHHPLEALLSASAHGAVAVTLGLHPMGVILWSLLEGMAAFFTHANARLPAAWERLVLPFLVTPGMHRIHHSRELTESNSNYGTLLPWWDRLFGTYRTRAPGTALGPVGVEGWESQEQLGFAQLLWMPFHRRR